MKCTCQHCISLPKTGKIWVADLETNLVRATRYNDGISGWYAWDSELTDWPENPTWNNCGNGPELQADNIHGPYKSQREAIHYVRSMFSEEEEN